MKDIIIYLCLIMVLCTTIYVGTKIQETQENEHKYHQKIANEIRAVGLVIFHECDLDGNGILNTEELNNYYPQCFPTEQEEYPIRFMTDNIGEIGHVTDSYTTLMLAGKVFIPVTHYIYGISKEDFEAYPRKMFDDNS